jgi:7,8-dihydropterin-6-yl-methyl-4-(beta-D-ribofuranosyl)aminobenzene 5'-phosphate synthase
MTITALMDDYCPKRGFVGEHGLSLWIETATERILFDAGQSGLFIQNARFMGIDLNRIDAVVLSHGHYDHGGGLNAFYDSFTPPYPRFFAGRGFDAPRRSKSLTGLADIGLSMPIVPSAAPPAVLLDRFMEIASDVFILPRVERLDVSEPSTRFRRLEGGKEYLDEFDDELSLVVAEEDGIVIIAGCAHRGIVNIAESARRAFPARPVKALVGGFHLVDASTDTVMDTVRGIAAIEPAAVRCSHCTGPRGFAALAQELGEKVSWLSCGMQISL